MRSDYDVLIEGNRVFNRNGGIADNVNARIVNHRTLNYMRSNTSVETCEIAFTEFHEYLRKMEYITPSDKSNLQDDAYYINAEFLPNFLNFLEDSWVLKWYKDRIKQNEFYNKLKVEELDAFQTMKHCIDTAKYVLGIEGLILPDYHVEYEGEETILIPPIAYNLSANTNFLLGGILNEYTLSIVNNNSNLNNTQYDKSIRDLANYLLNFFEPLYSEDKVKELEHSIMHYNKYKEEENKIFHPLYGIYSHLIKDIKEEINQLSKP